jgi:hypothetical protein
MKDQALVAEAAKAQIDVDSVNGEEVQQLVAKMFATPAPIIERTKQALIYSGK